VQVVMSSNSFAQGANQNSGNVLTERPSTRVHAAPGGISTICLGDATEMQEASRTRAAAVPASREEGLCQEQEAHAQRSHISASTLVLGGDYPNDIADGKKTVSSNAFANGANQNCGNKITDRPTTRLHQAPGGTSTICLGEDLSSEGTDHNTQPGKVASVEVAETKKTVSSNAFANGANQNAGNTITDRPTTRLHQAPGGTSTICLGSDEASATTEPASAPTAEVAQISGSVATETPDTVAPAPAKTVSSNAFANGANQNCGNTITDRPSTRVHQAPGGNSSVCLGTDTDNTIANKTKDIVIVDAAQVAPAAGA